MSKFKDATTSNDIKEDLKKLMVEDKNRPTTSAPLEQLAVLRNLTAMTETLHEAQIMQLKMWPLVLFDKSKVTLNISIPSKDIGFLVESENDVPKDFEIRFRNLEKWVKWLLGKDWEINVSWKKWQTKKTKKKKHKKNHR